VYDGGEVDRTRSDFQSLRDALETTTQRCVTGVALVDNVT